MNLVKTALTYVAIFSVGAVTSVSCFEPEFGNPSFRCNPSKPSCPDEEVCCSDDPAATQGRLPNYFKPGVTDATYGVPIFSGDNNPLSSSGMCVAVGDFQSPFPSTGCPVPCNPTWTAGKRDAICGAGSLCCQMQELDAAKDCVLDPGTNKWRPVTGADIGKLTTWGPAHSTNQDPQGANCLVFAAGGGAGPPNEEAKQDCYAQLTVANQRGFCYKACPCVEDVCDQKNPGYVPKCGAAVPAPTM